MLKDTETYRDTFFELDAWQDILHSGSWLVFVYLLRNHKDFLQTQANKYLAMHEDRKAGEELAKMKDCDKLLSLVSARIAELRNNNKNKEG